MLVSPIPVPAKQNPLQKSKYSFRYEFPQADAVVYSTGEKSENPCLPESKRTIDSILPSKHAQSQLNQSTACPKFSR